MNDLTLPLRSINGDRKVGSAAWRALFATYFTNGVFANPSTNLQVLENSNMTTVVKAGKAHIDGVFTFKRQDTIIQHDIADGLLKRIDRIVLRLDETLRDMVVVLKKGTPSSAPVAPAVQRDAEAYELVLADVFISNGVTQITQANITDQRLNGELCGVVHVPLDQVDTTTLFNQYQSWIEQQKSLYESDLATWTAEQKQDFEQWQLQHESDFDSWQSQEKQSFDNWFATIQGILDENAATNLISDLSNHKAQVATKTEYGHVRLSDIPMILEKVAEVVVDIDSAAIRIENLSQYTQITVCAQLKGTASSGGANLAIIANDITKSYVLSRINVNSNTVVGVQNYGDTSFKVMIPSTSRFSNYTLNFTAPNNSGYINFSGFGDGYIYEGYCYETTTSIENLEFKPTQGTFVSGSKIVVLGVKRND